MNCGISFKQLNFKFINPHCKMVLHQLFINITFQDCVKYFRVDSNIKMIGYLLYNVLLCA